MPNKKNIVMDRERFEMLSSLFFELNGEIVTFSRKKSDKVLSEFQVQKINQVLEPIQNMMKDDPYITNRFMAWSCREAQVLL